MAAACLPPSQKLDEAFWSSVLAEFCSLTASPISLPRWTDFKRSVLRLGVASKSRRCAGKNTNWLAVFRSSQLSPDEFDAAMAWLAHKPCPRPKQAWSRAWPAAAPEYDVPPIKVVPSWSPTPESPWFTSTYVHTRRLPPGRPAAPSPAPPPLPAAAIGRALLHRLLACRRASKAKLLYNETHHTSDWFNMSSNKELDERGSRASVSVHGLRLSTDHPASSKLGEMVQITRSYFQSLHTPEPSPLDRVSAQERLLHEVSSAYRSLPPPPAVRSGPFLLEETPALRKTMHNTAPGPDGIPYHFWKSLDSRIISYNKAHPSDPLAGFWPSFLELANDVKANGSSRCGFKNANVSLFFKKGDPTLPQNYRPISSMNTDCKLFTNLVNNRLSPWAQCKIHEDQKGFIPGRLITDHTRLAYEAAHLADITATRGFLVSLDQAKAYDRVDQRWLLAVLRSMGVDPDLRSVISDVISGCKSRVRINGGYSTPFSLLQGIRQGDPLSCLLFNFSIEPLAMRLRKQLSGFSVHGLPPLRIMFYADDLNLFLSPCDSIPDVVHCLDSTSYAIGSKFNHDKTDIKPLGSARFSQACFDSQSLVTGSFSRPPPSCFSHVEVPRLSADDRAAFFASGSPPAAPVRRVRFDLDDSPCPVPPAARPAPAPLGQVFPGAYILPPGAPLRVLGVWVSSTDYAADRWVQILSHVRYLIRQWVSIGASLPNRVLLAKALLLSRCYWLLDGNGIPPSMLRKISSVIMHFVRGRFSGAPYSLLEPPVALGSLNCPSLASRKVAYDLKFFADLISGPPSALWRVWTNYDLSLSTSSSKASMSSGSSGPLTVASFVSPFGGGAPQPILNPFLQDVHSRSSSMSDRLSQAFHSARIMGLDPRPPFPSLTSRLAYPILFHPAFTPVVRTSAKRTLGSRATCVKWECFISHSIVSVGHLLTPPVPLTCDYCLRKSKRLLSLLVGTPWDPALPDAASPEGLSYWPQTSSPLSCVQAFTAPSSIIATTRHRSLRPSSALHMEVYRPHRLPVGFVPPAPDVLLGPAPRVTHVWTGSSSVPSSVDVWSSGIAWISDSLSSDLARVTGAPADPHLAAVLAVAFALLAHPSEPLTVYTSSPFVLSLVRKSLVSMESDGWPASWVGLGTHLPPFAIMTVYKALLSLIRLHRGLLTFTDSRPPSPSSLSSHAVALASLGRSSEFVFDATSLAAPTGWVSSSPPLAGLSLSRLTLLVISHRFPPALLSPKLEESALQW